MFGVVGLLISGNFGLMLLIKFGAAGLLLMCQIKCGATAAPSAGLLMVRSQLMLLVS